jgi:predicted neuraminidase
MAKISRDHAETFSDASVLVLEAGMMVRSQPVVLANGDYLLPVYCETGNDTESVPADTTSLFLRYDVQRKIWSETNRVRSRLGNLQPALARIDDNYLIAYCRRGGDYRGRPDGWLVRTESRDGGRTWSDGADTKFPNPNAAVAFLRLASGSLLLVYNDSFSRRTPLTAALSTDSDKTYPHRRNLADGANSYGYPYAIQTSDGMIHVIYTSDNRGVINHAVFNEQTLLSAR